MFVIGVVAASLYVYYMPTTIRYRLTITALVDGATRTGSGVIEETYENGPQWLRIDGTTLRGEAVTLNLGNHGTLVALLRAGIGYTSFGPTLSQSSYVPYLWRSEEPRDGSSNAWMSKLKGTKALPLYQLPFLVRFRNINDPKTAEEVFPDDLTKSFGPGVKLVNASVTITDAPVTTGITKKIPWLRALIKKDASLIIIPTDPDLSSFTSDEFISGELQ